VHRGAVNDRLGAASHVLLRDRGSSAVVLTGELVDERGAVNFAELRR
jgi:hypothetical protein